MARTHPAVHESQRTPEGGRGVGSKPDGGTGTLDRPGDEGGIVHLPEATLEGHVLLGPQLLDQRDTRLEPCNPVDGGDAERRVPFRTSQAHAPDEPAARKPVYCGQVPGQMDGRVHRRYHDRGAQLEPFAGGRGERQRRKGTLRGSPDAVVPQRFCPGDVIRDRCRIGVVLGHCLR